MMSRIEATKVARQNSDGDSIIAVCFEPSETLVVTLLAIWKLGAAYLPLDATFPRSRTEHILRESEPLLVVTDRKGTAKKAIA